MQTKYDLIVIGAGAAGLMAAGRAAQLGAKVLILEKMNQPARKLKITGKGRCNLTNIIPLAQFLEHISPDARFLRPAFSLFFTEHLINLFDKLGVPTITERGGRVFPKSESAVDVAEALVKWNENNQVDFCYDAQVIEVVTENQIIKSVKTKQNEYFCKHVILATGGASYPATGSTGDGYKIAKSFGHTIIPIRPALVPFETAGDVAQRLQGLSLKNVKISVWVDGKKKTDIFGEMLFTHFGLSGPIVLTLSRQFVEAVQKKQNVIFSIDLKPALDEPALDARLQRDLNEHGKKKFENVLKLLLPQKLIPVCIEILKISGEKNCNQITAEERKRLRIWLKDFRFEIIGERSFKEAIVTAGGISLKEVDSKSMESKIIKNLFFAGEVLDLDADTGGYNLQIAFSTGWLAAECIAKRLKE